MPGPVSDSYDPEFGVAENAQEIRNQLSSLHTTLTVILGRRRPLYVLDLASRDLPEETTATLTEKEWRLLRFAVERARESI